MTVVGKDNLFWIVIGLLVVSVFGLLVFNYLGWVVFSIFMYYLSRPIRNKLDDFIGSKTLTSFLSLFLVALPIILIIASFLVSAITQLNTFLGSEMAQNLVSQLPNFFNFSNPEEAINILEDALSNPDIQNLVNSSTSLIGSFASSAYNLFISLILVFYLLKEDKRIFNWTNQNFLEEKDLIKEYLHSIDKGLNSIYFGYTLTIFAIIILTTIIYSLFNLFAPSGLVIPSVALLALLTGLFTLVPLVGRSIIYLTITLYLAFQASQENLALIWYPILFYLFMAIAFDNLIRIYIRPYLSGKQYETSLVMFAYLLGPQLFNWYGIFLGPLLMVLIVNFTRDILPRITHR